VVVANVPRDDVITEEIPAALDGQRLDRIVALLTNASRSDAARLIVDGGAMVDGVVVTSGKVRLRAGQRLDVDLGSLPIVVLPLADPGVAVTVIHEDADMLVIDKPAGLVVHPGAGNADRTLVNGLLALYPEIAEVGEPHRPGVVHRLDIGTSGLMVVARTTHAYHALVDALAARDVGRTYRAAVWGHPANPSGLVDAPIGRDHRDPMRMAVVVDGRPARTRYQVVAISSSPVVVAALECTLESGRTHQIRVHLAAIGHPVLGDGTYGGVRDGLSSPRPFLHAARLELRHPVSGRPLRFDSALPADLTAVAEAAGLTA